MEKALSLEFLRVVERAGRFLTIAGDEWHRRAVVEQGHRSCDLLLAHGKFLGDLSVNGNCHALTYGSERALRHSRQI